MCAQLYPLPPVVRICEISSLLLYRSMYKHFLIRFKLSCPSVRVLRNQSTDRLRLRRFCMLTCFDPRQTLLKRDWTGTLLWPYPICLLILKQPLYEKIGMAHENQFWHTWIVLVNSLNPIPCKCSALYGNKIENKWGKRKNQICYIKA